MVAANDSQPLWIADEANARGQVTRFRLGDGTETMRDYDGLTGRIDTIEAIRSQVTLQHHEYKFDSIGNLKERADYNRGIMESFCYDALNRLKAAKFGGCSGSDSDFTYDALGNIKTKGGSSEYGYGSSAGPHAVTHANGIDYHYDANGGMTSTTNAAEETVKQVHYSAFNLVP